MYSAILTSLIHLCKGFTQISLYWDTRQTHQKKAGSSG